MKNLIVTVAVCTANREVVLKKCLTSLSKQTAKKSEFEVVVVDNSIRNPVKHVVADFQRKNKNFRYVIEKKIGLSHARNKGWKTAKGQFVAYIDDDSIADKNWVKNIILTTKEHPSIIIFGGPFGRYANVAIPKWYPSDFCVLDLGRERRYLKKGTEWLSGTNMVFRKSILRKYQGFDPMLGMSGNNVAYGEETNLQAKIITREHTEILYVPKLKVKHLLAEYKISLRWLLWSRYMLGRGIVKSHGRKDTIFYHIVSFGHKTLLMIYYLFLPKPIPVKRRLYLAFVGMFSAVGAFENYLENKFLK